MTISIIMAIIHLCVSVILIYLIIKSNANILFISLDNNEIVCKYIYNKLLDICHNEDIEFILSDSECERISASGLFRYSEDLLCRTIILKESDSIPRRIPTLFHELGHYYGIRFFNDCSEEFADKYIKEILEKNFPSYICYIYRFWVKVMTKDYSYGNNYNPIKEYFLLKRDPMLKQLLVK